MNHKRKRPKSRRAGCLLCKPWKANGAKGGLKNQTMQERKAVEDERQQTIFGIPVVECDTLPEECRGDLVIGSWVDRYPLKMELQGGKIVGVIQPKVTT